MKPFLVSGLLLAGSAWAQQVQTHQVHVIEEGEAKAGRFEFSLYPAAVQLNGEFTQHVGTFGAVTWHLRERFALQLLGGGNWHNVESAFNGELNAKFNVEAQSAASLLWTWGLFGGVEVEPLVAKFTLFNGPLAHFGLVLNGGAGAGGTRHQLRPEGLATPASYGDTGTRFMATFAAGLRLGLGKHFTARVEVRDVAYAARIERINGCNLADLNAIRGGTAPASSSCGGFALPVDAALARSLAQGNASAVLHNVGMYVGAGFVF